jgi:hypothetical protein
MTTFHTDPEPFEQPKLPDADDPGERGQPALPPQPAGATPLLSKRRLGLDAEIPLGITPPGNFNL